MLGATNTSGIVPIAAGTMDQLRVTLDEAKAATAFA